MTKNELVSALAATGNYASRAAATQAADDVVAAMADGIVTDGKLQLVGFGTFTVKTRAARVGRHPATGEPIQIKAAKNVSFKAGKGLNERL